MKSDLDAFSGILGATIAAIGLLTILVIMWVVSGE